MKHQSYVGKLRPWHSLSSYNRALKNGAFLIAVIDYVKGGIYFFSGPVQFVVISSPCSKYFFQSITQYSIKSAVDLLLKH